MLRAPTCFTMILTVVETTTAAAQGPTDTQTSTCAALKALVARAGAAVLASSELAYETVHWDSGSCQQDETGTPAYAPTRDVPVCFVGWRCKQHNSDSGPV